MIFNLRFAKILRLEIFYMHYDMKESARRIQQLRIQHGYTQGELAEKLNVDRSFLSYIESGKKSCSIDLLVQLSGLLDASLDYIILGQTRNTLQSGHNNQIKKDIQHLINNLENFKALL